MTNSKANIDCGHYVELPVPQDAARVGAGELLRLTLTARKGLQEHRSFALESGAKLFLTVIVLPEAEGADIDLRVDLLGENAEAKLAGVYVCRAEQRLNLKVIMNHRVRSCTSQQLFKGVVAESSSAMFDGRITVAPDAGQTQAFQENHSLLLSDTAHAETRPQLEIYTDDVVCSHGATLGRLNLEEQFYMRSRGIPENEAKVLQMISFLAPAMSLCREDGLMSEEFAAVENAVRSL